MRGKVKEEGMWEEFNWPVAVGVFIWLFGRSVIRYVREQRQARREQPKS